jgi:hypothetical protein
MRDSTPLRLRWEIRHRRIELPPCTCLRLRLLCHVELRSKHAGQARMTRMTRIARLGTPPAALRRCQGIGRTAGRGAGDSMPWDLLDIDGDRRSLQASRGAGIQLGGRDEGSGPARAATSWTTRTRMLAGYSELAVTPHTTIGVCAGQTVR